MNSIFTLVAALSLTLLTPLCAEEMRIAALFTDHMVLQRERPVPVWGWANPGELVNVEFAGQKKSAIAAADGKWLVKLDPMPASSEGRELLVESAVTSKKSKITDVVVGDVWLCSGQSNMHFPLNSATNGEKEIAVEQPTLRFFIVGDEFGQKPIADSKGVWRSASPTTSGACSAVAYFFGKNLQQKLGVPIGLLISSVGGTRIESWMRSETLAMTGESDPLVKKWKDISADEFKKIESVYRAYQYQRDIIHSQAVKDAKAKGILAPPEPQMPKLRCHDCPNSLHNGMIAPLQPFAIRGAIWYQGESNSGQPAAYEKLLPAMIADWRQVWGSELPFLFVQLAPYQKTHPAFREAQLHIWQKTPHTAMVVTTDVGDANTIHPLRKRPVGERLALAALALSYGEKIEYSGPVFKGMNIEGKRAVLSFDHTGTGLMAKDAALTGFTLAGADGKFLPALAVIDGSTVVVTCEKISNPVAVRYGWAMMPDGNLFNREGLPAAPFRTDHPADQKRAAIGPNFKRRQ